MYSKACCFRLGAAASAPTCIPISIPDALREHSENLGSTPAALFGIVGHCREVDAPRRSPAIKNSYRLQTQCSGVHTRLNREFGP